MFVAIANEEREVCDLLLKQGIDVNRQNLEGFTALHVAAYSNQVEMLKVLVPSLSHFYLLLLLNLCVGTCLNHWEVFSQE